MATLACAVLPVLCKPAYAAPSTSCTDKGKATSEIVQLQTRLFKALETEDRAAWDRIVAADFKAFDRGKREGRQYGSDDLFNLIVAAHKAGRTINWSVSGAHVDVDCRLGVMSYTNVGSITEPGGSAKHQRWLEAVAYRKDSSEWRAFLFTSIRAEDPDSPEP